MEAAQTAPRVEWPRRRLFTRLEYERAAEIGLFGPEERLELIEGEIVQKVTIKPPHSASTDLALEFARAALPAAYVRCQQPLAINDMSEPEPDVAVVSGTVRDYVQAHPTTAILVIEVADTTLAQDRTTKAGLYAKAGIPEYWIVNLVDRLLEVHRDPAAMSEQPLGYSYRSITRHTETEAVAPLAAPHAPVRVSDLLP